MPETREVHCYVHFSATAVNSEIVCLREHLLFCGA
jgi:hypothetical protein